MLWGKQGQQPLGPAGHLGWALQGKVCAWMAVWEGSTHLWGWGMWAGTVLFSVTSPGRRGQGLSTDPAVPGYSTGDELCRAA